MPDEDENPQIPEPAPITPKKETVRITLPPKPLEMTALKRETVRIGSTEAATNGPKKETTRLPAISTAASIATPAPVKPLAPPPPGVIKSPIGTQTAPLRPPPPPGGQTAPLKVPGAIPPRPPSFGVKPSLGLRPPGAATAPLSPPPAPAPGPGAAPAAPVAAEASATKPLAATATPKKETARIQVPPQPKPMVPKATVKMPMPQPAPMPAAPTSTSLVPVSAAADAEEPATDPLMLPLSIAALVVSLAAVALSYLAFSA